MWWRNYSQTLFSKMKIEQVSGSTVQSFIQFFIAYQVEGHLKILKLSSRPLAFTSYKAFLKNKKRSGEKNISLVIFH